MSIIEVKNLIKTYKIIEKQDGLLGYLKNIINPQYREFIAVKNINFDIEEGELVGYIGENGAGKSTTIKMLTGLLSPTSGQILVNGLVPNENRIENNKNIGAVFGQKTQLWWDLPVIESFRLVKKMFNIPENEYKKNLKRFTEILELENLLDKQVKNLSLGQKMRCEIASTFLHNPKIVYLDEPTIGLDVFVKENIRNFIKDINREKKTTVILTTHDLKDIEDVCDRIILLDKGQIIYDGEKQKFKDTYGKYTIADIIVNSNHVHISNNANCNNFEVLEETENKLRIKFKHDEITIIKIMNYLSKHCTIEDISMKEPELEDILKEIYKGAHKNDKTMLALAKIQFMQFNIYKSNFYLFTLNRIVEVIVYIFVWQAIYNQTGNAINFTISQMITYYILVISFSSIAIWGMNEDIALSIRNGQINKELLNPISYFKYYFGLNLGQLAFAVVIGFSTFVICSIFWKLILPTSIINFILCIFVMILGIPITFFIQMIIGTVGFYTNSIWGMQILRKAIIQIFSGIIAPITLFPLWFQELSNWLPFKELIFTPVNIWLGNIYMNEIFFIIFKQIIWTFILYFIAKIFFNHAIKNLTINGG